MDHKKGYNFLDVGANIGFHTLYFAQLTGPNPTVNSFEPVLNNYKALRNNIDLNHYHYILTHNTALSNKNEQITIDVDVESNNPGAYNLFEKAGHTQINCLIGDEILRDQKVDFIKIYIEGYEGFILEGLLETIKKNCQKIIFEYGNYYQQKTGRADDYILTLLATLNYRFDYVHRNGLKEIKTIQNLVSGNILASPNE